MCLLCLEYQKQRLSIQAARRNLAEMREGIGEQHAAEVMEMLNRDEEAKRLARLKTFWKGMKHRSE